MSQRSVIVDITTSSATKVEQPLYISLSPATERRSFDRAFSKSLSPRPRSSSTRRRPRNRPSWASFWSAESHRLSALKSGKNDETPSRVSQDSLPNAETPHPGPKVDRRNPSNSVRDSDVDQKSTKSITSKFERALQQFGIHSSIKQQSIPTVPTSKVWETVYDGSYDEQSTEEVDFNSFVLELAPEISMDKSELEYLRRTQAEECLDCQRRMLFAK